MFESLNSVKSFKIINRPVRLEQRERERERNEWNLMKRVITKLYIYTLQTAINVYRVLFFLRFLSSKKWWKILQVLIVNWKKKKIFYDSDSVFFLLKYKREYLYNCIISRVKYAWMRIPIKTIIWRGWLRAYNWDRW